MTALDESIVDPNNEQVKRVAANTFIFVLIFSFYFQAVADFLAQICSYVGPNLESICLEFINEYTDDIIDQLVNNFLQPQQVCASIGACP